MSKAFVGIAVAGLMQEAKNLLTAHPMMAKRQSPPTDNQVATMAEVIAWNKYRREKVEDPAHGHRVQGSWLALIEANNEALPFDPPRIYYKKERI